MEIYTFLKTRTSITRGIYILSYLNNKYNNYVISLYQVRLEKRLSKELSSPGRKKYNDHDIKIKIITTYY
jgi:hypothetical protein